MTPHELIVVAGVAIAAASWLAGSLAPWWRVLEWAHRDYLDDIYDEGYDDGLHAARPQPAPSDRVLHDQPGHRRIVQLPAGDSRDQGALLADRSTVALDVAGGEDGLRGVAHHDWRADYAEQLAPAVLDAANLPGPAAIEPQGSRAGEHHEEFPLPAILHLGAEYDGGDQTFARVQLRQMTAINRHEAARKALLDECGVPFVPMEMCAA